MDHAFWHERWATGRIGFHRPDPSSHLVDFADAAFGPAPNAGAVLVPLCGKSVDLIWLAARFDQVIGVEFVPQAAADFFAEQGVTPTTRDTPRGPVLSHANIAIHVADVFAVTRDDLAQPVTAVYDRAALIALAPATRTRYADQIRLLAEPGARMLLLTLDYPQDLMQGPPFAVTDDDVRALFPDPNATRLARDQVSDPPAALGATPALTSVWSIVR